MKILAIETSCEQGSVALLDGDRLRACRIDGAANHSASLLHHIEALLDHAGWGIAALDAVAFGAGPGAFTGLRLACGVAQGIALGSGLGVAAVGSLQALALQAATLHPQAERIWVATDARMGEFYHAAFEVAPPAPPRLLGTPQCSAPGALALPAGRWLGVGSAFRVCPHLPESLGDRLEGCEPGLVPRAEEVALLAAAQARAGELLPPERAAPLYVRDKVAFTTAERLARGGRA